MKQNYVYKLIQQQHNYSQQTMPTIAVKYQNEVLEQVPVINSKQQLKEYCYDNAKGWEGAIKRYKNYQGNNRSYKLKQKFWTYLHNGNRVMAEKTLDKIEQQAYKELEKRKEEYDKYGEETDEDGDLTYWYERQLFPSAIVKAEEDSFMWIQAYTVASGNTSDDIIKMLDNGEIVKREEEGGMIFFMRRWYKEGAYIQFCKAVKEDLDKAKDAMKKYYKFNPMEAINSMKLK